MRESLRAGLLRDVHALMESLLRHSRAVQLVLGDKDGNRVLTWAKRIAAVLDEHPDALRKDIRVKRGEVWIGDRCVSRPDTDSRNES